MTPREPIDSALRCIQGSGLYGNLCLIIQSVPLATEPGVSLIILPIMRILQRNLKRTYTYTKTHEQQRYCLGNLSQMTERPAEMWYFKMEGFVELHTVLSYMGVVYVLFMFYFKISCV